MIFRSLSCGPIVVCLIMKYISKIFSGIQVLIEEKIPINRRFAKCFLLDVLASLESMMSLIMSLIQNSRSLTKSYLPFFSKPRNTGNTSDKRNTPNYVIHVIHLIQVFTSSTSLHIIQVMQVMLVMKVMQVSQVMQASLAHLWVDFRVLSF